jgi:acyl-CoA thioesterase-1
VGQAFVVGDQHQGGAAFLVQFEQQVADALAGVAVEVAGGFVGKQHVRFGGERAGNRHPLLFAAGELAWRVAQALAQADPLEQGGAFAGIFAAVELQRQHDVFQGIEAVEQLERLEDEADVLGAHAGALVFVEVLRSWPARMTCRAGQVEAGEQAEQGGFAGAGGADDGQAVALGSSRLSAWRMVRSPSALGTTLLRFCAVRMLGPMENPMRVWWLSAGLALMCLAQNAAAGTVLIVGDSISAGFGLDTRQGVAAAAAAQAEGFDDKVVNASISGDTSAGGQARLPALLAAHKPSWWCWSWAVTMACAGSRPAIATKSCLDDRRSRQAVPRCCCWACACRPIMACATPRLCQGVQQSWRREKGAAGAVFPRRRRGHA